MADPRAAPPTEPGRPLAALRGIRAIRSSLGLGEREVALLREVGTQLAPQVPQWVDHFYTRLLTDPAAQAILNEEARVIRLKRSLIAWFDELFTLPFDEDYERTRTVIGQTHVRIDLPPYLMVTAMSAVRRDVVASVRELYRADPEAGEQRVRAVVAALDMELALMLEAYRRHERQLIRQKDRAIYAERAVRRLADTQRNQVDAALCFLELADGASGPERKGFLTQLRDLLRELGRSGQPLRRTGLVGMAAPSPVRVAKLCRLALDNVSFDPQTPVQVGVDPDDLEMVVHEEAVRLAVEELLQNAATHGSGGEVRLSVRHEQDLGRFVIEVLDAGPGWDANIDHLRDVYARGIGLGLSFCELVAELHSGTVEIFRAETGGAGVALVLHDLNGTDG